VVSTGTAELRQRRQRRVRLLVLGLTATDDQRGETRRSVGLQPVLAGFAGLVRRVQHDDRHRLWWSTALETDPSRAPLTRPRPRAPMQMRSTGCARTSARISSAGSPWRRMVVTESSCGSVAVTCRRCRSASRCISSAIRCGDTPAATTMRGGPGTTVSSVGCERWSTAYGTTCRSANAAAGVSSRATRMRE
jgi:hypothetical protein